MPDVNVKGRYRIYTHDGTTPLNFATTYSSQLCSIRRPNPNTFITISQYVPGSLSPFTTFDPGSSYTIVTRDNTANFSMGPYTRADRLPSSVTFKTPNFYHGLDKNSITVAISSYSLSVNAPLNTVFCYIPNQDGYSINSISFDSARYNQGLPSLLTHFTPNSSYQIKTRTNFTFFAPLQSEMGNTWVFGSNEKGQYGLGHQYSLQSTNYRQSEPDGPFLAERMFGNWVKIVENFGSVLALSACGAKNKLFVCGRNDFGQLGLGYATSLDSPITVFKNVPGNYLDICTGLHSMVVDELGELYVCGWNESGQLGLGNTDPTYTFTRNPNFTAGINPVKIDKSSICTGASHSLVRDVNGTLWTCGNNDYGQLGAGYVGGYSTLFRSRGNIGYGDIGAGTYASIYVSDGKMYACGYNYYNSSSPTSSTFFRIGVSNAESASKVSTFTQEICAFNDITNLWVGGRSIFVKRSSQSVLWACGTNVWGGLGMAVYSTLINGHRKYIDIRALQPTVIPSDTIYKFFPAVYIALNTSARTNLYWIDNTTFELKTLVLADSYFSSKSYFEPYEKNLQIICSSLNGNVNSSFFTTVLMHNRSPAPIPLVPSDAPNAIFVPLWGSYNNYSGDTAFWMRSTDAYNTTKVSQYWAYLNSSSQGGNPYWLTRCVFDFKDNNNIVVGTFGKTDTQFNTFKQIVKNISTWNVSSGMNDVITAGTTVATWNNASKSSPYYISTLANGGNWPVGHVDMFVHRNSNTAVYVFTQYSGVSDNSQTNPQYGLKGAWTFTVNLANNEVGSTTTLTNKNLCMNRFNCNCSYNYVCEYDFMPKITRPLRKLPDGTVIFKSLYLNSNGSLGANYGATALIGKYNTPTWNGFTDSVEYVIPNSADDPNNGQLVPAWAEFAKIGSNYYLAWCGKTINDARTIGGGLQIGYRTQANLTLRNLQSGIQVIVDTSLNTSTSVPFGAPNNIRMQPYDIIGEPSTRRIYVAYAKYVSFTGNPDDYNNVLGIFVKRYDEDLNLIDTTQLCSYTAAGNPTNFGPALTCPVFSYYVDSNGVIKLILAYGSNSAGYQGGSTMTGDYVHTNTPSINNTWTQVFNQYGSNASRIYIAGAGNSVISI
jgi:alpha-tubulin suppressor-like RCC1 family protein